MSDFAEPCSRHMATPVYSIPPTTPQKFARDRLLELGVTSLAVIDTTSSDFLGVVTRTDLYRAGEVSSDVGFRSLALPDHDVAAIMSPKPICVDADSPVAEAARVMVDKRIHRVFVQDKTGVIGVLSTRDVMRVVAAARCMTPLYEIMSSPVITVRTDQTIAQALELMDRDHISSLVVLEQGWPCGVVTHEEVIAGSKIPLDQSVDRIMSAALLILPMDMPVFRCAANAASLDVRQVVASRGFQIAGVASGLDFCRIAAA